MDFKVVFEYIIKIFVIYCLYIIVAWTYDWIVVQITKKRIEYIEKEKKRLKEPVILPRTKSP